MEQKRPTIIVGHYGSGKTEFAANYALRLQESGLSPVVADMDIVNPYFRARELKIFFKERGISVLSSSLEDDYHLDMPALAASLRSCFEQKDRASIIDVGGDPTGATVLARYAGLLSEGEYNMWIVVNANRPQTAEAEMAADYLRAIEAASRLKISGIISNTHMLRETTAEDIFRGDELVKRLSVQTGTEVVYTAVPEFLMPEIADRKLAGEGFPIKLIMRPDWL